MIIVQAQIWPQGNQAQSYELLHATISNQSSSMDTTESYIAHVLARPRADKGIIGYEADVEVTGHNFQHGFAPLLMTILNAAHDNAGPDGLYLPPSRLLARLSLRDAHEFEERLKAR